MLLCLCCSARRSSQADQEQEPPAAARAGSSSSASKGAAAAASAAMPVQLLNESYAMQAARRAEKRRLCSFIRLLDYMLADSIHSLVVGALQHMLECMHKGPVASQQQQQQQQQRSPPQEAGQQPCVEARPGGTPLQPSAAPGSSGSSGSEGGLVLELEVLLDEGRDQLLLQPPPADFLEGLAVWLRGIERVMKGVARLLSQTQLQVGFGRRAGGCSCGAHGFMLALNVGCSRCGGSRGREKSTQHLCMHGQ